MSVNIFPRGKGIWFLCITSRGIASWRLCNYCVYLWCLKFARYVLAVGLLSALLPLPIHLAKECGGSSDSHRTSSCQERLLCSDPFLKPYLPFKLKQGALPPGTHFWYSQDLYNQNVQMMMIGTYDLLCRFLCPNPPISLRPQMARAMPYSSAILLPKTTGTIPHS